MMVLVLGCVDIVRQFGGLEAIKRIHLIGMHVTLIAAFLASLATGSIDVTERTMVSLAHHAELSSEFGILSYVRNNSGYRPYPVELQLQVVGPGIDNRPVSAIAGSNAEYYPGYLLEARLESLDATISVPFSDPQGAQLGLPSGLLLVKPGTLTVNGEQIPIITIDGVVNLSLSVSEAVFDPSIAGYAAAARIRLRNLGADLVLGRGKGSTMQSSVSVHSIRGIGPVTTAGVAGKVMLDNLDRCAIVIQ